MSKIVKLYPENNPFFKEKDLENMLVADLSVIEHGLQFIERQRIIQHGRIDIFAIDKNGTPCIIELKMVDSGRDLAWQCCSYQTEFDVPVRVIVVAPQYHRRLFKALTLIKNVELKTYYFYQGKLHVDDFEGFLTYAIDHSRKEHHHLPDNSETQKLANKLKNPFLNPSRHVRTITNAPANPFASAKKETASTIDQSKNPFKQR